MRIISTILFYFLLILSPKAQPELVDEFFPGPDGTTVYTNYSGTYNQDISVKIGDDRLIFSAEGAFGQELYKIEQGQLSLITDLRSGEESSNPQFLTIFEEQVYFIAQGDQGARIYTTDGTSEGTDVAFDLGDEASQIGNFSELLVGRDGKLYFGYGGSVYAYSNNDLTQISHTHDINITASFNHNEYNWAQFKSGITVLNIQDGELFLLSIIDDQVTELATVPRDGSFDKLYAIESFGDGVFFSIEAFDDEVAGDYTYLESTGLVQKIAEDDSRSRRSDYLGDKACIVSSFNNSTYLFNGQNTEGIQINENFGDFFSGSDWERERISDGIIFTSGGGVWYDTEVLFVENNASSASLIHTTDDITTMITDGSYTFYFAESELGDQFDDLDLFAINHFSKEVEAIATLLDPPFNNEITPVGVIADELYFFGILDDNIGLELYKIDIGFSPTSVESIELPELELVTKGNNNYVIDYTTNENLNISIQSIDGRLLHSFTNPAQIPFEVKEKGMILITVQVKNQTKTFKVYN